MENKIIYILLLSLIFIDFIQITKNKFLFKKTLILVFKLLFETLVVVFFLQDFIYLFGIKKLALILASVLLFTYLVLRTETTFIRTLSSSMIISSIILLPGSDVELLEYINIRIWLFGIAYLLMNTLYFTLTREFNASKIYFTPLITTLITCAVFPNVIYSNTVFITLLIAFTLIPIILNKYLKRINNW